MKNRVLVVTDNDRLMFEIGEALTREGFKVFQAGDALEGMRRIYDTHPSVIIMEESLSVADTIDLCAHAAGLACIAVLILGQEGSSQRVVEGLNRGADFYMPRPISIPELAARAKALNRRCQGWPETMDRVLDVEHHCLRTEDRSISLTATEFRLLSYLMLNKGRVVPNGELLSRVWPGEGVTASSLSFYIYRLRQKLNAEVPHSILTHYGVGYRLGSQPAKGRNGDEAGLQTAGVCN